MGGKEVASDLLWAYAFAEHQLIYDHPELPLS
jgi:hypothetical protein